MKKLLLLFLLAPSALLAQGSRYDNFVLKPLPAGGVTPVSGALITVCTSAGTGTPCTPKVSNIYSDEALTTPITGTGGSGTTNSDANGNYGFYLAAGSYVVTVTGTGIISTTTKLTLPCNANNCLISALNGAKILGSPTYPATTVGLQQCLADAITSLIGICDARGVTNLTINSEIDVGNNSSVPVVLLGPALGTWSVTITDGVSCGIKQFDKTAIIGPGTTSNGIQWVIAANSSATNVQALYCTNPSPSPGNGSYIRAEGFLVRNNVGATMVRGATVIQHTFDGSTFTRITTNSTNGVGLKIYDVCCGTRLDTMVSDGQNGAGAKPVQLGDATLGGGVNSGGLTNVSFYNNSWTHPGAGQFIADLGFNSSGGNIENVVFHNQYLEPNSTDTGTAGIEIEANSHNIFMFDFTMCGPVAGGSTAYAVDIASGGATYNHVFINGKSCTSNGGVINDHQFSRTLNNANGLTSGLLPMYSTNEFFNNGYSLRQFFSNDYNPTVNKDMLFAETSGGAGVGSNDVLWGDSTGHCLKFNANNAGASGCIPQVVASGTSTMAAGAVAGATCATAVTTAATNTATTDAIEWSYATAPTLATDALLHISPYVTSGNVNFTRCNPTAASITGTAIVINWRVIR